MHTTTVGRQGANRGRHGAGVGRDGKGRVGEREMEEVGSEEVGEFVTSLEEHMLSPHGMTSSSWEVRRLGST